MNRRYKCSYSEQQFMNQTCSKLVVPPPPVVPPTHHQIKGWTNGCLESAVNNFLARLTAKLITASSRRHDSFGFSNISLASLHGSSGCIFVAFRISILKNAIKILETQLQSHNFIFRMIFLEALFSELRYI